MRILIDAHVVQAFYIEDRDLGSHEMTADVSPLFTGLLNEDELWIDESGHIEQEWRNLVGDREWFDGWFFDLIANSRVMSISCADHRALVQRLGRDFGFPRGSGDRWFVITAASLRDSLSCEPAIVSEDMHFHDPRQGHLRGRAREQVVRSGSGRMAAHLRRREHIHVRCVARHLGNE